MSFLLSPFVPYSPLLRFSRNHLARWYIILFFLLTCTKTKIQYHTGRCCCEENLEFRVAEGLAMITCFGREGTTISRRTSFSSLLFDCKLLSNEY
ncbi:hypothetical protein BU24DRAFT_143396 [Aaosphaeria arxii CBS 175.79]|uniref:Uncharacterized protein n=1 Tax=Aaosphaeria arxii CBS 175.79 TaxID=1450172 RepID=A0A6A5XVX5_9PLEO|nr:uncharacterized protein BU24DRAFT_143396 [Aaosphaeria arxii CBS 175.79]KAF2017083.1 hypothetical protein BU24DRAFT_143396 [Aaosphaeria arxii CBS 175.79]